MTNRHIIHLATLFFLLTLAVVLLSWIGSIYGWQGVRSLLNAEGMRWVLRNAVENYVSAPWLGQMLALSFGAGVCVHSGWWSATLQIMSRKQKTSRKGFQAWKISVVVAVACGIVYLVIAFGPWGALRSINGQWESSPLAYGTSWICALGLGLTGIVYGYASDHYRTDSDVVAGLSCFIARCPSCMVTLFFVAQFFSSLHYVGIGRCLGLSDACLDWAYRAFVVLSFAIG